MVKSSFTLYKHTHMIAVSIFAILMIVAGAAIAVVRHAEPASNEVAARYLGRFVVTPTGARFDAAPATHDREQQRGAEGVEREHS